MASYTLPITYTAIDKLSPALRVMEKANASFGSRLEATTARSERLFNKLTPGLSDASKQFTQMATTAAAAAAVIGGASFSVKAISDYETAVAGFRTIVSDLSDKDFEKYKTAIGSVAKETKKSSIDVANSFSMIAGLNATFADTSEGLAAVSKASIILSKASKDDLAVSASNLVGIMNQYSFAADQANRTINVLAAGQAVGAASITQTAEAFTNFGSVASGANITLEQSVGLIETLGKFSVFGAEAGTKLRGSVLKLQQAQIGYKSGQFQIIDALEETRSKIEKLSTAKQKDAAILKIFGAENIATGKILINNIKLFEDYTKRVTGTNEAQKAAAINSDTLAEKLNQLRDTWINLLVNSAGAKNGIERLKNGIGFLIDNLDTVVKVGLTVVGVFAVWKATIIASKIALFGYNVVLGVSSALSTTAAIAVGQNTIAMNAYKIATGIATAGQWLWNAALDANPIGLLILGIAAAAKVINDLYKNWGSVSTLFSTGLSGIKRDFIGTWLIIENSFMTMLDKMTIGWKTTQFSFGAISQKEFTSSVARINQEQKLREKAIVQNSLASKVADRAEGKQILQAYISDAKINDPEYASSKFATMEKAMNKNSSMGVSDKWEAMKNGMSDNMKNAAPGSREAHDLSKWEEAVKLQNKELINPKEAQAKAMANQINLEVNVSNEGGQSVVNAKDKSQNSGNVFSLTPKTSSTMAAYR